MDYEGLFQVDGFQDSHNHPISQEIRDSTLKSILKSYVKGKIWESNVRERRYLISNTPLPR